MRKNWIAVASSEHARRGCAVSASAYMQLGHGKLAPLRRLRPADRVAYYSPTITFGAKDSFQSFVSIGVVQEGEPYAFDMGGGFVPFRRDVVYVPAQEASILPLLDQFVFVENRQRWGYKFRFGLFEVSDHDMRLIALAMRAERRDLVCWHEPPPAALKLPRCAVRIDSFTL